MANKPTMTAIGCHVYAGGFAEGVKRSGFEVIEHIEFSPFGIDSFKLNFPDAIVSFDHPKSSFCNLVYANPPCAPFSTIGSKLGVHDPRLLCWAQAIKVAVTLKPDFFVGESVQQLWTRGRAFAIDILRTFHGLGYETHVIFHDAKFLGLAQQRRRVFLIASKHAIDFQPPINHRIVTLYDAINDLQSPGPLPFQMKAEWIPAWALASPSLATACKYIYGDDMGKSLGLRVPRFIAHRCVWDEPCGTLVGDIFFHPDEPRPFGLYENARIMGFPDDWKWPRPDRCQTPLLAKGVTPNCAQFVCNQLKFGDPARHTSTFWDFSAPTTRKMDYNLLTTKQDITNEVLQWN